MKTPHCARTYFFTFDCHTRGRLEGEGCFEKNVVLKTVQALRVLISRADKTLFCFCWDTNTNTKTKTKKKESFECVI